MDQRGEVGIPGADDEGGDVFAFEGDLDGVDHHLDVCGVLAASPHPLRDLDQLDVAPRQLLTGIGEHPPVGIGLAGDDTAPLGEGIADRFEVELHPPQRLPHADGQVLEVDEQGDALFFHLVKGRRATNWYLIVDSPPFMA